LTPHLVTAKDIAAKSGEDRGGKQLQTFTPKYLTPNQMDGWINLFVYFIQQQRLVGSKVLLLSLQLSLYKFMER